MQLYVVATSGPFYKKQRIFGERHICHISGLRYFMLMARAENYRHAHIQFQIIESNPNEYIPLEPSCINVYRSEVVTRGVFSTPATHLMAHHLSISISPPLFSLSLSTYLPTYMHLPVPTCTYLPTSSLASRLPHSSAPGPPPMSMSLRNSPLASSHRCTESSAAAAASPPPSGLPEGRADRLTASSPSPRGDCAWGAAAP